MKNILNFFISLASFLVFIVGLYFLADIDLFYAIGLGLLLLAHELGHVIGLKKLGSKLMGVYFFPFLGAITVGKNNITTENDYAYFKYAGPFLGTTGVLITLAFFFFSNDSRFLVLAFIGAIFNLINMIPITLFDGYGIMRGIVKNLEWYGFFIVVVLGMFVFHEYILTLLVLLIFTLISESPTKEATGFKIHEVILSIIFISVMAILSVRDPENLVWNMSYTTFALFVFGFYIKVTCFDDKTKQQNYIKNQMTPLTRKEKFIWGTAWALTTVVLTVATNYINGII